MISKDVLEEFYVHKKLSMLEISRKINCSATKVSYWMRYHNLKRRSISEGVYVRHNPHGDPFSFRLPVTEKEHYLYGLGLGLYWGEGTKANKYSVRLGNTDPKMTLVFISFLEIFFGISRKDLRYGIQVFSTMKAEDVLVFWMKELKASKDQFMKVIITPARGKGSYGRKIEHGVLTVYYHNKKMRDILIAQIEKLKKIS